MSPFNKAIFNGLLLLSVGMFLVGISLPLMEIEKFWFFTNNFSLLSSIELLWQKQEFLIAVVLALFSIVTPIVKSLSLLFLANTTPCYQGVRQRVLDIMETWGKWSMLDVFVVAVLFVAVKLESIVNVRLHEGLYWFVASIILLQILSTWLLIQNKCKK